MALSEFERGYVIACSNLVNLHDQPGMASDVLLELGVSRQKIMRGEDWSDYDRRALKEIFDARRTEWSNK